MLGQLKKSLGCWILLLIALEVSVAFSSMEEPQIQLKGGNQITKTDKRGTEKSPLIIKGNVTTKAADKSEGERKQEEEKIKIETSLAEYAGWTARINFLLVVVTLVLAFFTYKLWRSTNDLVTKTEKSTRALERAYVHAGGHFPGNVDKFQGDVGNYGRTSAFVSRICMEVRSRDNGVPPIPVYTNRVYFGLNLYPGQPPVGARVQVNKRGISNPFVYGRVWYKDVFGDRHSEGFIYVVNSDGTTVAMENAPEAYSASDTDLEKYDA